MSGSAASLARAPRVGLPVRLLSDDRLVRMAAEGDTRAFAQLHERHAGSLYRYSRSIVRHDQDAQDVVQTTMARALAALAKGPPDAPLRPWLFRIAHNEAISLLRARRDTTELDDAASLTAPSVEGQAEERERLELLVADLGDLPERQRAALVMRELSGLSHAEIATALGVSLSGAKQAIFEARIGLGEFAKGRAMDCAEIQRLISDADGRTLRGRPMRAHLRSCTGCRALRDAIAPRQKDLAALAPPLPAVVGAGLLAKLLGGGSGGGGTGGGVVAAAGGKAATAALGTKLALGAAVLATAGAAAPAIVARVEDQRPAAAPAGAAAQAAGAVPSADRAPAALDSARGDRPAEAQPATDRGGSTHAGSARPAAAHGTSAASHRHRRHAKQTHHPAPRTHGHSHRPATAPGLSRTPPAPVHPAKPAKPAAPVKAAAPVKPAPAKPRPVTPVAPPAPAVTHAPAPKPAPVAAAPAAPPAPAASTPPGQQKKSGK